MWNLENIQRWLWKHKEYENLIKTGRKYSYPQKTQRSSFAIAKNKIDKTRRKGELFRSGIMVKELNKKIQNKKIIKVEVRTIETKTNWDATQIIVDIHFFHLRRTVEVKYSSLQS